MKFVKNNLPNFLTCLNLLCGCMAIMAVLDNYVVNAALWLLLALVFDFLDGFVARLLHTSSPIGKELDSLADLISFGFLPGIVIYTLFGKVGENTGMQYSGFIITAFSAVRLAKFNLDTRQTDKFIGLPTPANTILIFSLLLILEFNNDGHLISVLNKYSLIGLLCICSYLLIAELPLFALKFKSFQWKGNQIRFVFIILVFILGFWLHLLAIPLIIISYIGLSMIENIFIQKTH